ncbi:hypothetical protein [Aurantiacibacter rhizosphaerae]|uniref:CPBP family intramembrane metalloprotease n=1 Tax=Aurantiacibacter rhizosphaerae TaxID=2691582 RepID=A0A844XCJ0_9SPHN|nr:hypothetical protein [Aurantiacibacter rhizosphaerae]MWV27412.1 hypothetical protein [Aurantiacibacter rhizosphaerae]
MTQYLAIITAYGAVAILVWLSALLYPRLIPAALGCGTDRRWRRAGLFALAALTFVVLEYLRGFWLVQIGETLFLAVLIQVVIYLPFLGYILLCGGRRAAFVPERGALRSLLIGVGLAILALVAYLSTFMPGASTVTTPSFSAADSIVIVTQTLMQTLALGAFLAMISEGWSARLALTLSSLVIVVFHVPEIMQSGLSAAWLGPVLVHLAIGLGLFSAVLFTRNIVWFWPVYAVLALAQTMSA